MSKGPWRRDALTGLPMTLVARCDERHLNDAGHIDVSSWSDCNLFDVRSIAAAAGYADWRYFKRVVLKRSDQPFHVHRIALYDADGRRLAVVIGTHTNSAQAGRVALDDHKREQASWAAGWPEQHGSVAAASNIPE